MATDSTLNTSRKPRRMRFGLRSLLMLIAVCSLVFAWAATIVQRLRLEEQAERALEVMLNRTEHQFGNFHEPTRYPRVSGFAIDWSPAPFHERFIAGLAGEDVNYVTYLSFEGPTFRDADANILLRFHRLKRVELIGTSISDEAVEQLRRAFPRAEIIVAAK